MGEGWSDAERHLASSDPVMAELIRKHGPCRLTASGQDGAFEALVETVIYQQLAPKAAESIYNRVKEAAGGDLSSPESLAAVSDDRLRQAGLSARKVEYLRDLSAKAGEGSLRLDELGSATDEEVVSALTRVKGLGRWSAEMFMMFVLGRPDVFSAGDLGLRNAIHELYGLPQDEKVDWSAFASRWAPYRSAASWYLWKSRRKDKPPARNDKPPADAPSVRNLRAGLRRQGVFKVGVADLVGTSLGNAWGYPRAVVLAVRLSKEALKTIAEGATPEYYAEYQRDNEALVRLADSAAATLAGLGHRAFVVAPSRDTVDREALSSSFSFKAAAALAGLGWIGKSALLVTPEAGSAVRLAAVLTDAPLPADKPCLDSACGECSTCVHSCPAHALTGNEWRLETAGERGTIVDARACEAYARSYTTLHLGTDKTICGVCVVACPLSGIRRT